MAYARKSPRQRPATSFDGRWIAYEVTDENGFQQIYLANTFDQGISSREAVLISKPFESSSNLGQLSGGNGSSFRPQISADGSTVVFHSAASDLVPNDKNAASDVFVYFINERRLIRLTNPFTGEEGDGASYYPDVNEDGTIITFESRHPIFLQGHLFQMEAADPSMASQC